MTSRFRARSTSPKTVEQDHIRIAARVRPLSNEEKKSKLDIIVETESTSVNLRNPNTGRFDKFSFNNVYVGKQKELDDICGDVVSNVLQGYNACIMAYGQTGSGKTYTMIGDLQTSDEYGIIPRIVYDLFAKSPPGKTSSGETIEINVSFLEIYDEKLYDLLSLDDNGLVLKEHPEQGMYVRGLKRVTVQNENEVMSLLERGNRERITAATKLNTRSSRSHAIFMINWSRVNAGMRKYSTVYLVDLAGSEKVKDSGVTGKHFDEAVSINSSLSILSKVINELSRNPPSQHISFRESKLTYLLKNCFGGNSRTWMIANIAPTDRFHRETLNTLRYVSYAHLIVNEVKVNQVSMEQNVANLQSEIARLRAQNNSKVTQETLQIKEDYLRELTQTYEEKISAKDKFIAQVAADLETRLAREAELRTNAIKEIHSVLENEKQSRESNMSILEELREAQESKFLEIQKQLEALAPVHNNDELIHENVWLKEELMRAQEELQHLQEELMRAQEQLLTAEDEAKKSSQIYEADLETAHQEAIKWKKEALRLRAENEKLTGGVSGLMKVRDNLVAAAKETRRGSSRFLDPK